MGEGIYTKGIKTVKQQTRYEDHSRHLTEAGMTLAQRKAVLDVEEKIKNNKDESLHIIGRDGTLIESVQGKGAKVEYGMSTARNMKDAVVTHNHPRSIGRNGIASIGNSLSPADLHSVIENNALEMRARTPRYTFSFRRNGDSWKNQKGKPLTKTALTRIINEAIRQVERENQDHIKRHGTQESVERAKITHWDKVNKIVARKIGATYTHKRNS